MAHFVSGNFALVEPVSSAEVVCSGVARVEFLGGGLACLVLYRRAASIFDGAAEAQVTGRVFLPMAAVPEFLDLLTRAIVESGSIAGAVQRFLM